MDWLDRNTYMERLWAPDGTRDIKVITGMRRSGRSELMKAFSASVARRDPSSNNVYIDLLDLDNEPLLEYHTLYHEIIERHKEGTRNRLFIDKVQLCEGFEKAINSIHARGGWDIYLTGSNAFLLSSDLATLFTGRRGEVHILPFSFGEYRSYFDEQGAVDDDFDGFIRRGGLAGSYDYDDISESYGFLRRGRIGTPVDLETLGQNLEHLATLQFLGAAAGEHAGVRNLVQRLVGRVGAHLGEARGKPHLADERLQAVDALERHRKVVLALGVDAPHLARPAGELRGRLGGQVAVERRVDDREAHAVVGVGVGAVLVLDHVRLEVR